MTYKPNYIEAKEGVTVLIEYSGYGSPLHEWNVYSCGTNIIVETRNLSGSPHLQPQRLFVPYEVAMAVSELLQQLPTEQEP